MSKHRTVKSEFWVDEYIEELNPNEKLVFLNLLTSPQSNILGIYKNTIKRIAFDTGLQKQVIENAIKKFSSNDKVYFIDGYIIMVNHHKHQNANGSMREGIKKLISFLPSSIIDFIKSKKSVIYNRLYIGYYRECIDSNSLNINKGININKDEDKNEAEIFEENEELKAEEKRWEEFKTVYPKKNGKLQREETGKKIFFKSSIEFQKKSIIAAKNYSLSADAKKGYILGLGNFLRDSVDEWQSPEVKDKTKNKSKSMFDIANEMQEQFDQPRDITPQHQQINYHEN